MAYGINGWSVNVGHVDLDLLPMDDSPSGLAITNLERYYTDVGLSIVTALPTCPGGSSTSCFAKAGGAIFRNV